MDKYIRLDDAILQIQRYGVGCFDGDDFVPEQAERFVIAKLKEIPAADVRSVVRGKWIELPPACNGAILTKCSACKHTFTDTELGMAKHFCPRCGAEMEDV